MGHLGTPRHTRGQKGTFKDTLLIQFHDDLFGTGKAGEIKERSVGKGKVGKVKEVKRI